MDNYTTVEQKKWTKKRDRFIKSNKPTPFSIPLRPPLRFSKSRITLHQIQNFAPIPENAFHVITWNFLNSIAMWKFQHRLLATKVKSIEALFSDIPEHYKTLSLLIQRFIYSSKTSLIQAFKIDSRPLNDAIKNTSGGSPTNSISNSDIHTHNITSRSGFYV